MLEMSTLGRFVSAVCEGHHFSNDEKSVAIELDLYIDLYRCVGQRLIGIDQMKTKCQNWKVKHSAGRFFSVRIDGCFVFG